LQTLEGSNRLRLHNWLHSRGAEGRWQAPWLPPRHKLKAPSPPSPVEIGRSRSNRLAPIRGLRLKPETAPDAKSRLPSDGQGAQDATWALVSLSTWLKITFFHTSFPLYVEQGCFQSKNRAIISQKKNHCRASSLRCRRRRRRRRAEHASVVAALSPRWCCPDFCCARLRVLQQHWQEGKPS
jgi:hypothetical protein